MEWFKQFKLIANQFDSSVAQRDCKVQGAAGKQIVEALLQKQPNVFAATECWLSGSKIVEEHHAGARAANKEQDTWRWRDVDLLTAERDEEVCEVRAILHARSK